MQILNNIQKIRWEQNISLRELSKLSGVAYTTIDIIENESYSNPTLETALRISKGLKKPIYEVFDLDWENIDFD